MYITNDVDGAIEQWLDKRPDGCVCHDGIIVALHQGLGLVLVIVGWEFLTRPTTLSPLAVPIGGQYGSRDMDTCIDAVLLMAGCGGRVNMDEGPFGFVNSTALVELQSAEETQHFVVMSSAMGIYFENYVGRLRIVVILQRPMDWPNIGKW